MLHNFVQGEQSFPQCWDTRRKYDELVDQTDIIDRNRCICFTQILS